MLLDYILDAFLFGLERFLKVFHEEFFFSVDLCQWIVTNDRHLLTLRSQHSQLHQHSLSSTWFNILSGLSFIDKFG